MKMFSKIEHLNAIFIFLTILANKTSSNESKTQCNRTQQNFCFTSNNKNECSEFVLYPKNCVGLEPTADCELMFDWNIVQNKIEFTLTKFNYNYNQWNGILFSNQSQPKKSDIIIALMPQNGPSRIIDGSIQNGSDIIISESDSENSSLIFNKSIVYSIDENYVEIKFSRYLFSSSMLSCGNFYIYLLNGSLYNNSIVYDSSNRLPKPIGPFCFNSFKCTKQHQKLIHSAARTRLIQSISVSSSSFNSDDQLSAEIQIQNKNHHLLAFSSLRDSRINNTNTSITSSVPMKIRLESDEPYQTTTYETTMINNSTESRLLITTEDTTHSSSSSSTTAATTAVEVSAHSFLNFNSSESPIQISTQSILLSTIDYLENASTSISESTVSQTVPIPTTTLPAQVVSSTCSQTSNFSELSLNYDNISDRLNFTITKLFAPISFAIYINNNDKSVPDTFLLYGEINNTNADNLLPYQNISNKFLLSNIFQSDFPALEGFTLIFSLPSQSPIYLRDSFYFNIYSNKSVTNRKYFLANFNSSSVQHISTNNFYMNPCQLIPKKLVQFYLQLKINQSWSDDYFNLTSASSINLKLNINSRLTNALNNDNEKYQLESFDLLSLQQTSYSRKKRDLSLSSFFVLMTSSVSLKTSGTNSTTKNNFLKILQTLDKNIIMTTSLSDDFPVLPSVPTTSAVSPIQSDYPSQLAIALSLSLIITIILLGSGLAGFLYWRKTKFNGSSARSAHTNPFLRIFGDRFSGNRYRSPPAVRLDGLPPSYNNDEFELNHYENQTFDNTDTALAGKEAADSEQNNFTDFTGSREVGIDVGEQDEYYQSIKQSTNISNSNTNSQEEILNRSTNNIKNQGLKVPSNSEQHKSNRSSRRSTVNLNLEELKEEDEEEEDYDNLFNKTKLEKINKQNEHEMTRDDFDKFLDTRFSELLDDKNIQELFNNGISNSLHDKRNNVIHSQDLSPSQSSPPSMESPNEDDDQDDDQDDDDEEEEGDESELNNIFNKDNIEKNLPEIFGQTTLNDLPSNLTTKTLINNNVITNSANRVSAPLGFSSKSNEFQPELESDSLSTSSRSVFSGNEWPQAAENLQNDLIENDNDDDISLKSEDIDDYKTIDSSAFKNLRIQPNNNFVLNSPLKNQIREDITSKPTDNNNTSKSKANETNEFLMTELPKPRICLVKVNKSFDGLGIHLCGTKNHMIKNIETNSPADLGGLKPGDKILVINSENVEEASYTTVVNRLKEALLNHQDINLVVMNIIEYNMFKEKNPALENLKSKSKQIESRRSESLEKSNSLNDDDSESEKYIEESSKKGDLMSSLIDFEIDNNAETKFELENFVNAEFNPFHDVPNEMFAPFLHYSSIPPPPANFDGDIVVNNVDSDQVNQSIESGDFFNLNTNDPFQMRQLQLLQQPIPSPAIPTNVKQMTRVLNDDSNSDLSSDNSVNSLNQHNQSFRFSDFNLINMEAQTNNFDDDFLKTFQTHTNSNNINNNNNNTSNKLNELTKNEDVKVKKTMWNSSLSDYSDNGNYLIENETNDIMSQVSTPKIRDRF